MIDASTCCRVEQGAPQDAEGFSIPCGAPATLRIWFRTVEAGTVPRITRQEFCYCAEHLPNLVALAHDGHLEDATIEAVRQRAAGPMST